MVLKACVQLYGGSAVEEHEKLYVPVIDRCRLRAAVLSLNAR